MENLDDYITNYIYSYLKPLEIILVTSISSRNRVLLNLRYKLMSRCLIHKVYQDGIRDGITMFIGNTKPHQYSENNDIRGFLLGDTPKSTDLLYSSVNRMDIQVNRVLLLGNRYKIL